MKNLKTISVLSVLMLSLLIGVNNSSAATLATTLKGKILLQVEQNGEAWYVNPTNELRYYLGRPADAFNVMRELGLGISNKDFDSFSGYAPSRLSGRILLKVADSGKAYYVNTSDLKMYYLGRPADAFNVMRELGLGITDKNLNLISVAGMVGWKTYSNTSKGYQLNYPTDWQIENGLGDSVRVFNPRAQGKPETDQPSEAFRISFEQTSCKASSWEVGFGLVNYRTACVTSNPMIHIGMTAFSDQTKIIEDQILSTLKFTGLINGLFEGAVNKSDFSTASKYFADNVYVTLEGSSCCGEVTTSRAKQELERINGLIFTFNPNDAVVKEYMAYIASQYPNRRLIKNSPILYFDEYTIGVESDVSQNNKASIGYKVSNNKITDLFINVGRDR